MEIKVLTDPLVEPDSVLEKYLTKDYKIYQKFAKIVNGLNLRLEWKFYNDVKYWLSKILGEKKNYGWISVLNTGFTVTVYFKNSEINDLYELDINKENLEKTLEIKPERKNQAVIMLIKNTKIMNDAIKILQYKMGLK
jgi:hypothetical protein